jgi:hypothetical protein
MTKKVCPPEANPGGGGDGAASCVSPESNPGTDNPPECALCPLCACHQRCSTRELALVGGGSDGRS